MSLTSFRRRHGLRWQRELPDFNELGFTRGNLLRILVILLIFGIVGSMDYADEQRQEAEAAQERYAQQQAAMLACLNGGSPGYYTMNASGNRVYLVCDVFEVSDENVKQPRRGKTS